MKQVFKKFSWLVCLGMMLSITAFAQNHTVSGVITDDQGEPVVGAAILVKGTTTGAVTEVDGSYSISVAPDATLLVSCIGYKDQEVAVGGNGKINLTLESDAAMLDNAVVIGYGTAKRADVTGSIASMGGEELREVASGDISRSLNGRVAGVQMTQTSSRPGSSMEIRIRGTRSLSASNDPLIVLDGVPFMGQLSDISPADIKSIDILKDASATAIYGSRGANGVIIVTSVKGVSGQKPKVTFNNYVGAKTPIKVPMMGAKDYIALRKTGTYQNSSFESDSNDTDWQDLFYRTGLVQSHELSVTGGTQKGSYRFGTNYYRDQAVIPTQDYDRFNINGSLDQNITDWLKLGFSTTTSYNRSHGNQLGLYSILQLSPLLSPYGKNTDGKYEVRQQMPNDNVYVLTRQTLEGLGDSWVNENNNLATYNNAYIQLSCPWVEGLSFKQTASMNYRKSSHGDFTDVGVNNYTADAPSSASQSSNETKNWALESLLTYDHIFASKHHVNVTGMYSVEQTTYTSNGISAKNIPNAQFLYYNPARSNSEDITVSPSSYNYWQAGLQSWMFRAMYTYADRYMISAAVRSDASSRLAKGHQWHTYPAISVGWNLANENFMKNTRNVLDELKIRLGYGETSNQSINPYQTLGSLGTLPYNFGDTFANGYYVTSLPNENLGWEFSRTVNFGVDFSLFKGRLYGTVEYYVQNTHDILMNLNLPSTAGVSSYTANIGQTQNKGIEISLNGTIIQKGDWRWDAGINVYSNQNKLVALASGQNEDIDNQWFVGYPINSIYDYEYDGLWQAGDKYMDILEPGAAPGDIKVKYHGEYNADGTPVRAIDANDRVPINADPIFMGGFNTTLTWKNLDLTILGNFQCGGILISTLYGSNGYLNMLSGRRGQVKVDYWTPENTGARFPRPNGLSSNDNPKYGSTLGYFDGGYLKIHTITIGYNFENLRALKQAGISKLRVYATAQNPFVLFSEYTRMSGLDPEPNATGNDSSFQATAGYLARQRVVGTNTPNTRNFIFGVNFTF